MSIPSDDQQIFLRHDLHNLSTGLQSSNFNVRKYRVNHQEKKKRKSIPTNHTLLTTKYRISTDPGEDNSVNDQGMYRTHLLDKFLKKNEKKVLSTGLEKYADRSKEKKPMIQLSAEDLKKFAFMKMQKKHHKGPLNKKTIESWLNNILLQSLQLEIVDASLGNAALKKFQIDENTLLTRGIRVDEIYRIYSSLFVYSIGYNNFLKGLIPCDKTFKNIWRVFSVLLEYCAQGKYETLIGTLQREKALELSELQQQLQRKQQVIEKNEELNEEKNIQIFKEIRFLKEENINLNNEKEILYEDFQKTDQAFNEEVALRLKFENKINELFGVHRQLGIKHDRLLEDYRIKVVEWRQSNEKYHKLILEHKALKSELSETKQNLDRQTKKNKYSTEFIESLKEQKNDLKNEANMAKHNYEEEKRLSKEYLRRLTQVEIEMRKMNEIIKIKDKSWQQVNSEYQLSILENKKMYNSLNEQRKKIEQLLLDKKQFNNRILSLMADASFHKTKKKEYEELYLKTDLELKKIMDVNERVELRAKVAQEQKQAMKRDLEENYINIKNMHNKNFELEEELGMLRLFKHNLNPILESKSKENEKFRSEIETLQKQVQQLTELIKRSELKLKVYKAEIQPQLENYRHVLQRIKEENQGLENEGNNIKNIVLAKQLEIQNLHEKLRTAILNFKNEKFERLNLKQNYSSTLLILQKKNQHEKQQSIQISELKEAVSRKTHQYEKLNLKFQNLNVLFEKTCNEKDNKISFLQQIVDKKSSFVHPFIFEDTIQNYRITKQKLSLASEKISEKIKQIQELVAHYEGKLMSLENSHAEYVENMKNQSQKQLFILQTELQYEKQKNTKIQKRLTELEDLADTYMKKIEQRTTSQRESLFASIIDEKSKSIDELTEKLSKQVKIRDNLKEEIIKKRQEFDDKIFQIQNVFRKQRESYEERLIKAGYEAQFMQNKISQLRDEILLQESQMERKIAQRLSQFTDKKKSFSVSEEKSLNKTKPKWKKMEEIQAKNSSIKRRNQMVRKMKLSHSYYNP